ncbi:right-handed parallel beta-helix repeat-containing protein [Streptomyces sp. NPDC002935]|uniref:right-handed parallel beta-helix repeat-containing protein n=1 Tax=Streptomyces sp. NPDC002935 TaxID=3154545 RepID=UPI0033A04B26
MSYVRFNDQHDDGLVTQFRERLASEVRAQTDQEFEIFQDRNDIQWGENWQQRIDNALDAATLLLVVITPSFFHSSACRAEVARFLKRETDLSRQDLILPVYYISAAELDDPELREEDEMARMLASRQYADWRELRFEPFTSPPVRKTVAQLASRMRDAFWRPLDSAPDPGRPTRIIGAASESIEKRGTVRVTTKSTPPTHIVDPYHRGDFTTVGAAIKAAKPGDRILVRPGLYMEGLLVDKPLEILGDGPVADIEIRSSDADALMFQTSIGRVENLTLHQAGGNWYGVDVTQGRLELEGCDITSRGLACVAIHDGADPRLRRNQIHGSKQGGVFVYDGGFGTLEDNDISANTMTGVAIKTGGEPTLRRNRIHDNKASGVFIYESGSGTLEDNDISANTLTGVAIKTGGEPTLRRNRIHDNKVGVYIDDGGFGTLEDNDISANTMTGVQIKTGSDPTLRRNRIHDNKTSGVFIYESGSGTLEDNDISTSTLAGVAIKTGGEPTLRRNRIHDNKASGVFIYESGSGTLEDNDISANTLTGVEIKTGGKPILRANRINGNGYEAVYIHEGGGGVIEDNDLTENAEGAWDIAADCEENVIRAGNEE